MKYLYHFVVCFLIFISGNLNAQNLLLKKIPSFFINNKSISFAIDSLSKQSGILFSYQTDIFSDEHAVSIAAKNKSLEDILSEILQHKYSYSEISNYIVINKIISETISGIIYDDSTGIPLDSAIISTIPKTKESISNQQGKFSIKISLDKKIKYLCVSKEFYKDEIIAFDNLNDKQQIVRLKLLPTIKLPDVLAYNNDNTSDEKVRLHLFGGVSHGVNGIEAAGIYNYNKGNGRFIQIAGAVNIIQKSLNGIQLAGLHNYVGDSARGIQISALLNKTEGKENGVQIGVINHARILNGLQIGIINTADSSNAYSLGAINLSGKNHFPKISLFASNYATTNIGFKLGNEKLYTSFFAGFEFFLRHRNLFGFGLGHDFIINKNLSVSLEANIGVSSDTWYSDGKRHGILHQPANDTDYGMQYTFSFTQLRTSLNMHLFKGITLFAGPTLNQNNYHFNPYEYEDPNFYSYLSKQKNNYFIGWQVGITNDTWLQTQVKSHDKYDDEWSLQSALALDLTSIRFKNFNADIRLQKNLMDNIAFIATTNFARSSYLTGINITFNNNDYFRETGTVIYQNAGLKLYATQHFFIAAQAGILLMKDLYPHRFNWSPELGWDIGKKTSLSINYQSALQNTFLRIGYTFWNTHK